MTEMTYRRLGRSGLKVSVLSFGSWVTFGEQIDTSLVKECNMRSRGMKGGGAIGDETRRSSTTSRHSSSTAPTSDGAR